MKLEIPFISYTVCKGEGEYVLRSTEIEVPEIGSREYAGGNLLIDHVHYYGDGGHWYLPRLNEINIRKPWTGLLPNFEGDQSGSHDVDIRRAFLLRKLSEHIFRRALRRFRSDGELGRVRCRPGSRQVDRPWSVPLDTRPRRTQTVVRPHRGHRSEDQSLRPEEHADGGRQHHRPGT
ncbi:hypothetical protein [Rhizobium sp. BK176]|uniref:hypothetical protein n=1 Tax=Rhizobium sp. BK176 TaxID=2587071 RepID=UPI002168A172|nr:hypothetical protein [Rhizobium sp. BK176]